MYVNTPLYRCGGVLIWSANKQKDFVTVDNVAASILLELLPHESCYYKYTHGICYMQHAAEGGPMAKHWKCSQVVSIRAIQQFKFSTTQKAIVDCLKALSVWEQFSSFPFTFIYQRLSLAYSALLQTSTLAGYFPKVHTMDEGVVLEKSYFWLLMKLFSTWNAEMLKYAISKLKVVSWEH